MNIFLPWDEEQMLQAVAWHLGKTGKGTILRLIHKAYKKRSDEISEHGARLRAAQIRRRYREYPDTLEVRNGEGQLIGHVVDTATENAYFISLKDGENLS